MDTRSRNLLSLTAEQRLCIARLVATLEESGDGGIDNELLVNGQAFDALGQKQRIGIDMGFVGGNQRHEGTDVGAGVASEPDKCSD